MPRRKIDYPMVKNYILALSKIAPDGTRFEEFLEILCGLLHESKVVRFSRLEVSPEKMFRAFASKVLHNNGFELKRKQVVETYFIDGKMLFRRTKPNFIYKTQEE